MKDKDEFELEVEGLTLREIKSDISKCQIPRFDTFICSHI